MFFWRWMRFNLQIGGHIIVVLSWKFGQTWSTTRVVIFSRWLKSYSHINGSHKAYMTPLWYWDTSHGCHVGVAH
jgi:hypothetical protein